MIASLYGAVKVACMHKYLSRELLTELPELQLPSALSLEISAESVITVQFWRPSQ